MMRKADGGDIPPKERKQAHSRKILPFLEDTDMKSTFVRIAALVAACTTTAAFASDLSLSLVLTNGGTCGSTATNTIDYEIHGVLSDSNNEGIALVAFDMTVSGVDLSSATTVNPGASMGSFVYPDGLNNPLTPGGPGVFGGIPQSDGNGGMKLVQIGGGQNTINNNVSFAPAPIGVVTPDLGQADVIIASGTLTLPDGVHTIEISNGFANVITQGETGPVFATEAAGSVTGDSCVVTVAVGALVEAGRSCQDHGGTTFCVDIGAGEIEPRATGVTSVEIDFDGPVTAGNVNIAANGAAAGAYGGSVGVAQNGANSITVSFSPALDNADCWTIAASGDGTGDVVVGALRGDVDQNASVNTADITSIKPLLATVPVAGTFLRDVDANGSINTADITAIKPLLGTSTTCP
jgi:hypothetical protein